MCLSAIPSQCTLDNARFAWQTHQLGLYHFKTEHSIGWYGGFRHFQELSCTIYPTKGGRHRANLQWISQGRTLFFRISLYANYTKVKFVHTIWARTTMVRTTIDPHIRLYCFLVLLLSVILPRWRLFWWRHILDINQGRLFLKKQPLGFKLDLNVDHFYI